MTISHDWNHEIKDWVVDNPRRAKQFKLQAVEKKKEELERDGRELD